MPAQHLGHVEVELARRSAEWPARGVLKTTFAATRSVDRKDTTIPAIPMDRAIGPPAVGTNLTEEPIRLSFLGRR